MADGVPTMALYGDLTEGLHLRGSFASADDRASLSGAATPPDYAGLLARVLSQTSPRLLLSCLAENLKALVHAGFRHPRDDAATTLSPRARADWEAADDAGLAFTEATLRRARRMAAELAAVGPHPDIYDAEAHDAVDYAVSLVIGAVYVALLSGLAQQSGRQQAVGIVRTILREVAERAVTSAMGAKQRRREYEDTSPQALDPSLYARAKGSAS